jgi:hypothetical protein
MPDLESKSPKWVDKVVVWFVIGILSLFITVAVVQTKVGAVENRQAVDEQDRRQNLNEMVTHQQFDQFEKDLYLRLDRMEKSIDRLSPKR